MAPSRSSAFAVGAPIAAAALLVALTAGCGATAPASDPTIRASSTTPTASRTTATPPAQAGGAPPSMASSQAGGARATSGMTAGKDYHGELHVAIMLVDSMATVGGTVAPGQYVTVVNKDTEVHTLAFTGQPVADVRVPHGELVTFPAPHRPGHYTFTCPQHPQLRGELQVQ